MKKQVSKKSICKEMYKAVPDDIKVVFGKFYFFSLIYLVIFLGIYPFLFVKVVSDFSLGLIVGLLSIFYIYIILDTKRKVKTFTSIYFYLLIFIVFLSISFSVVKYFI